MNEIDVASAKSPANDPCSDHSRLGTRNFDHHVQFGTTNLVVVAQAAMRFRHERPKRRKISLEECLRGLQYALVLGHNVTAAPVNHVRQHPLMLLELG